MTASPMSRRCLPVKITEVIIAEAWSQCATTAERWDLYRTLSATHPLMHELVVTVAVRYPCFKFGAFRRDIELYKVALGRAASFAQARGDTESRDLTSAEHVCIDITLFVLSSTLGVFIRTGGADERVWRDRWIEYLSVLQTVVPKCSSLTLLSARPLHVHAVCLSLRALASFAPLTHLYLDYDVHGCLRPEALVPISSVRFLRIKHCPTCMCNHTPHWHVCHPARLLHAFPNVQHLHLDRPVFLKLLDSPHSLHTVTLEAPPVRSIPGMAPFSSLIGYNISAALRRGFLQWPRQERTAPPPTIVVHTGLTEPPGFKLARLACAEHGVTFRRKIVYME
ncbi:hypothetical protein C8T65DRAFT_29855 [Cerioporus squamosus]|nr:hypothetical protein C8T65DRAFT_29855 [Cerioporus squamosus]